MREVRFAFRGLVRNPGFTLVAVTALALGIGANAAIFTVVHAVLLDSLPFERPERLLRIHQHRKSEPTTTFEAGYQDFSDWRDAVSKLDLAAFASSSGGLVVEIDDRAERLAGELVTGNFLSLLGASPVRGRLLELDDDQLGAERVAVLSERLWRRRFGAEDATVGRSIEISGERHRIVGIVPADFDYPIGAQLWLAVVPAVGAPFVETRQAPRFLNLIGRLADGATVDEAESELNAVIDRISNPHEPSFQIAASLSPFVDSVVGDTRRPLAILFAAAGLVLLIACANVANLQIVRGLGRAKEIAIRRALGEGWGRLARMTLVESSLLAVAGAALGLLLARKGLQLLIALSPLRLFRGEVIEIDGTVLLFTLALAVATALITGMLPSPADLPAAARTGAARS